MTDPRSSLDRLLELDRLFQNTGSHKSEELEYNSLKKEIQGLIEKGENYDYLFKHGNLVKKQIESLEQQNKALTEQVRSLNFDLDDICRLCHTADLNEAKNIIKNIDSLKEQIKQLQEELAKK